MISIRYVENAAYNVHNSYLSLSADIKMYNYKIIASFVSSEMAKAGAKKTGFNIMIVHFYILRKLDIIRYDTWFFSIALHWILIGFEAMLKTFWLNLSSSSSAKLFLSILHLLFSPLLIFFDLNKFFSFEKIWEVINSAYKRWRQTIQMTNGRPIHKLNC